MDYTKINADMIDRRVDQGWQWGIPITHETYAEALQGKWDLFLTPVKPMPHAWIGAVKGKKILGLASGGGQQMPVLSALGAECTVLDYSSRQIESERLVAEREGYSIECICADMTKRLPFPDETFDVIVHPVSNCYIEDVFPVFRECYRVLKKGGILVSGLDNGINYLVNDEETEIIAHMPYNPLKNPDQMKELQETDSGVQFSHTVSEQIGGQLQAGFRLTDLYEDTNGAGRLHERNIYTFMATRAVKE